MFYSNVILTKKGPLGYVWLAATIGERSISKKYAVKARIAVLCDTIQTPDAPFALRLSAHLLLGVARVYARKSSFVLADMNSLLKALHACPSRFEANATWGTIQSSPTPRKQLREGAKRKYHFNADGVTQAENTAILRPSCNKQDMNRCKKSSRLDISEANKAFDSPVIDSGVMFLSPRFGSHYSDGDDAKYPVDISAAMEMAFPNEVPLQTYSLTDNDQIKSKSTSNNSFKADPHEISLPSPSMFYLPERRCDFSNVLVDLSENQNSRSTPDNLPPTHMYQSSTDSSLILATDGWHQGLVGDNIEAQGTFDGALKRIIEQQLLKNSPTRGNAVMAVNSRKRQREDSSSIEVSGDDKRLKKGSEGKEEEVEHLGKRICQNINYNGIDAPSPTDPSNARTRRSKFDRATELSTSFLRNCLADTSGIVNSRHHSARKRKNAPLTSGIDLDLSCLFAYSKPSGPEFTHMWEELVLHPLKSKSINNRSSHGEKRGENQQGALQSTAVIYPRDAPGDGGPAASNGNSGVPNSGSYSTTNANKPFSAKPRNDAHVESVRVATTLHAAVTNDKMFQSADLELERPRGAVPEKVRTFTGNFLRVCRTPQ